MSILAAFVGQLVVAEVLQAAVHHFTRGDGRANVGQFFDDVLDAGELGVAEEVGGEVDAMHQRAAINPLLAGVPSFDGGRVQQFLTHVLHLVEDELEAGLGLGPVAYHPQGAYDGFHRALDAAELGVLEGVGVEQDTWSMALML